MRPDLPFLPCIRLAVTALAAAALSCASTGSAADPNARLARLGIPVPRLVQVPAGAFTMGDEAGSPAERPAHRVTLASFWMGAAEVTIDQYAAFVADTGYRTSAEGEGEERGGWIRDPASGTMVRKPDATWRKPYLPLEGGHPVVLVTLADAMAYAGWLADRSGLAVRLPTEAQWEYACKAGDGEAGGPVWHADSSGGQPRRAGAGAANAWGLHDLRGNVWEWTREGYRDYAPDDARDPVGPEASERGQVLRGGSWNAPAALARCSFREEGHGPQARAQDLGFRIVVEP